MYSMTNTTVKSGSSSIPSNSTRFRCTKAVTELPLRDAHQNSSVFNFKTQNNHSQPTTHMGAHAQLCNAHGPGGCCPLVACAPDTRGAVASQRTLLDLLARLRAEMHHLRLPHVRQAVVHRDLQAQLTASVGSYTHARIHIRSH